MVGIEYSKFAGMSIGIVPIGSIIAWAKSLPGCPSLPANFVECNGQVLSDNESPLNGQTIPDLNGSVGTARFLRGQTTSGGTGGSETHTHAYGNHSYVQAGTGSSYDLVRADYALGSTSTLPSYYGVVWIMRTK